MLCNIWRERVRSPTGARDAYIHLHTADTFVCVHAPTHTDAISVFIQNRQSLSIRPSCLDSARLSHTLCHTVSRVFPCKPLNGKCDVDSLKERDTEGGWLQHVLGHVCRDRYAYIVLSSCRLEAPPHVSDWLQPGLWLQPTMQPEAQCSLVAV